MCWHTGAADRRVTVDVWRRLLVSEAVSSAYAWRSCFLAYTHIELFYAMPRTLYAMPGFSPAMGYLKSLLVL